LKALITSIAEKGRLSDTKTGGRRGKKKTREKNYKGREGDEQGKGRDKGAYEDPSPEEAKMPVSSEKRGEKGSRLEGRPTIRGSKKKRKMKSQGREK